MLLGKFRVCLFILLVYFLTPNLLATQVEEILPREASVCVSCSNVRELSDFLQREFRRIASSREFLELEGLLSKSRYAELLEKINAKRDHLLNSNFFFEAFHGNASFAILDESLLSWVAVFESNVESNEFSDWFRPLLEDTGYTVKPINEGVSEGQSTIYCENFHGHLVVSNSVETLALVVERIENRSRSIGTSISMNRSYMRAKKRIDSPDVFAYIDPAIFKRVFESTGRTFQLDRGEIAAIGLGLKIGRSDRCPVEFVGSVELTFPLKGVFRAVTTAQEVELPPIDLREFSAVQAVAFDWPELLSIVGGYYDALNGESAFRTRLDEEMKHEDSFSGLLESLDSSVVAGYVKCRELNHMDYVSCLQFASSVEAKEVVHHYLQNGLRKNYPLSDFSQSNYQIWYRNSEELSKLYRDNQLSQHEQLSGSTPFGREAIIQRGRWIIFCSTLSLEELINGEVDEIDVRELKRLDLDLTKLLSDNQNLGSPFAVRVFQASHWLKWINQEPIAEQAEASVARDKSLASRIKQARLDSTLSVSDEELRSGFYSVIQSNYGKHVGACFSGQSNFSFCLDIIRDLPVPASSE